MKKLRGHPAHHFERCPRSISTRPRSVLIRTPFESRRRGSPSTPGRGRPRKGMETGPTVPRSVRFPAKVWKHLEKRAKAEGIPLHAALRAAVMAWINKETERP